MHISKKVAGGLGALALGVGSLALGVSPAEAASGHTVSNICGNWSGANHAVSMANIWGSWDLVPCGYTYTNIAKVYYGGPGVMKVAEYPNTCFFSGGSAVITANTSVWTQLSC